MRCLTASASNDVLELNNLNLARILKRQGTRKLNSLFKGLSRVTRGEDETFIVAITHHNFINNIFDLFAIVANDAHELHSVSNEAFDKGIYFWPVTRFGMKHDFRFVSHY